MLVSLTFKVSRTKIFKFAHNPLILMTKRMTYRAFYYKIQMSVTPDKNFISTQNFR